ncbi:Trk system potassium transporter TrkA [Methanosarcinales archaeon]|uniref:Potassium transporter TrkA n=1 Tax=Candidatus Syntropharchaeum caldarium TaxID=1838285 RepID=A0A1F2PAW4_9EURY|nr:MAG: potassium transporter TrkA [Candidatus Syntrophoarchaeum caldarius]RLG35265.1 MAG: Trk system potassium transporter TrkA [Methanosarcinales archaeon]
MKVIIIGGGEAGFHVAASLSRKNDVIVIEKDPEACERVGELDVQVIQGNGADVKLMQQVGVKKADLVVALTGVDEVNIVACMGAKLLSRRVKTIARVSNPDYINEPVDHRKELGMDVMVCPELSLAREIAQVVSIPAALDVENFVDGKVKMVEFEVKEGHDIAGKKLKDAGLPAYCIVAGIFRGDRLLISYGDDVIQPGDRVVLVGELDALDLIQARFGELAGRKRKILIVGGGQVGLYLLEELTKADHEITLIEIDQERCMELAERYPDVLVINGDGANLKLLKEENLSEKDVVVAVTDRDEKNLLCALLAKQLGTRKAISRTDHADYTTLFEMVGVDVAINPILATVNEVMKFTMSIGVESLVNIEGTRASAIELIAKEGSEIVGKQLKDARFPRGALVSVIVRGEKVIVPSGMDVIEAGDRVVIFSYPDTVEKVEKLFE